MRTEFDKGVFERFTFDELKVVERFLEFAIYGWEKSGAESNATGDLWEAVARENDRRMLAELRAKRAAGAQG